jgi:hypothetical protein
MTRPRLTARQRNMLLRLVTGLGLGIAFGLALDNFAVGFALTLCFFFVTGFRSDEDKDGKAKGQRDMTDDPPEPETHGFRQ